MGDLQKAIKNLDVKKWSSSKQITVTILKQSAHIYLLFLSNLTNHYLHENAFPDGVKQSEVIRLYKTLDPLKKENYRPVSFLPHVSKVFEGIPYEQKISYMNDLVTNYITGFRKLHGNQHCLSKMLQNCKNA